MLKVENINVYYGNIHALKGISFDVNKGQIVTLIGSNGAGKTTTLRAISSLIKPKEGDILYEGSSILKTPAEKLVSMGLSHVPEGRKIFVNLTVSENLLMGAYSRKGNKNKLNDDLAYIFTVFPRLKERAKQMGGTLSGGEQQMLAIGRALMSKPKLLMLDEPSMGLAPIVIEEIFSCLKGLNKDGLSILLVEQNANIALELSDYGYCIETGEIAFSGNGKDLLKDDRVRKAYLGEE
ncbi:MAG: ABC transporter ATP-binding protein [Lachnospiraceae bacterium]|nr:ABC transporter ATP-binding protein [Lachnospiraceae bacterium]